MLAGVQILEPVLSAAGFVFSLDKVGGSSGGSFASGSYRKSNRVLELHFRYSLGLVTYHIGRSVLDHQTYMRMLGVDEVCQYPGFSDDPLDGFRHLRDDLERFGGDFLTGTGKAFKRCARAFSMRYIVSRIHIRPR